MFLVCSSVPYVEKVIECVDFETENRKKSVGIRVLFGNKPMEFHIKISYKQDCD